MNHDRFKLIHGPYVTPRFHLGDVVTDEARGFDVVIVGITDTRIPWPVGKPKGGRAKAPVIYADLERALHVESGVAICHWWGVTAQTVSKWRKALGIGRETEGTFRLRSIHANGPDAIAGRAKAHEQSRDAEADAERRRKISAGTKGKFRKWSTIKKIVKARTGTTATPETKAKLSAFAKQNNSVARLNRPPAWTAEDDAILKGLSPRKAAMALKRTMCGVYQRRHRLKITDTAKTTGRPLGD